jgi:hypothetical protein
VNSPGRNRSNPDAEPNYNDLREKLVTQLAAIEGVTLDERPNYTAVKVGKRTLGYLSGTKKFRVEAARRSGDKERTSVVVTKASEIAKAVKLADRVPTVKAAAAKTPPPAPKRTRKAKEAS